jgi:putative hydrolase of the HAD superfamily
MLSDYCICFDLDDTLFNEIDFIKSGYKFYVNKYEKLNKKKISHIPIKKEIINNNRHIQKFIKLNNLKNIKSSEIINEIREHIPSIIICDKTNLLLKNLKKEKAKLCIITDGRILTQTNKIKSLKIKKYFDYISISEELGINKPDLNIFKNVMNRYPNKKYIYIADNPKKDFISPNNLNWMTIGIINKEFRVHSINRNIKKNYKPYIWFNKIRDINLKEVNKLISNFYN